MNSNDDTRASYEARRAIYEELSLEQEVRVASRRCCWGEEERRDAERDYRDFLWLCYRYPDRAFPMLSSGADQVWHEHILNTRKYADDCEKIFGRFLHHSKFDEQDIPSPQQIAEALQLWEDEFGRRILHPGISCDYRVCM
jgi:hypothetical protein